MKFMRHLSAGLLAVSLIAPVFADDNMNMQSSTDQSASASAAAPMQTEMKADHSKAKKKMAKVVNINTASQQELMMIKGFTKRKAQAIVKYREDNGAFKSVDDLANVKGISKKMIDKYRSRLTV